MPKLEAQICRAEKFVLHLVPGTCSVNLDKNVRQFLVG